MFHPPDHREIRHPDRPSRSGLTLIELILVVSIIVVVTAMAIPAIQRTISNQAIHKGADRIRVAMGQARVHAIRNSEVYAVFYTRGGSWFNVAALTKYQEQADRAARRQQNVTNGVATDFEEDLLPRGVTFVAGQTSTDSRSAEAMDSSGASGQLEMVLFYPDGTSQDAKLTVQNREGALMAIELRGLTGNAKTMRVDPGAMGVQ